MRQDQRTARRRSCCRGKSGTKKRCRVELAAIAGADRNKKAQRCRSPAPTGGQARGGARDWKAARRDAMKITATRSTCSTACEADGTGSVGGAATKELPSNDTVAQ